MPLWNFRHIAWRIRLVLWRTVPSVVSIGLFHNLLDDERLEKVSCGLSAHFAGPSMLLKPSGGKSEDGCEDVAPRANLCQNRSGGI